MDSDTAGDEYRNRQAGEQPPAPRITAFGITPAADNVEGWPIRHNAKVPARHGPGNRQQAPAVQPGRCRAATAGGPRARVDRLVMVGRVIDLDQGWPTVRLDLEPLVPGHAAELGPLLDDITLHEFTGGQPLSAASLAARYARLARRRSGDGSQLWGNWLVRVRSTGLAAGTVQATMPAAGPGAGFAEVAWVVARQAQGRGYAREAARSLVARLHESGWLVAAHIHPRHLASQHVARAAGLSPSSGSRDGEIRWTSRPVTGPNPAQAT